MMGPPGAPDERRQDALAIALIAFSLVLITLFDVFVYPQHNVTILYTIPVLIGALLTSPRVVVVFAAVSLALDAVNAFAHHQVLESWLIRAIVLVVVDGFAVLIARQRRELMERTRALGVANAHLRELEQQREEWMSIIAHDLRQPITIITGYTQRLVKQAEHQAPSMTKPIGHILASAQTLNRMITDLLDVSRIEARRLTLEKHEVDLAALVREAVERTAGTTGGHPIRVTIVPPIPRACVDPVRIEQVLGNLLSNAAKYSFADSEIAVSVSRHEQEVEISVTNAGPGIPPDELPCLFSRFYRTRAARTGSTAGLGLGLYISRGLVEAHGGRIWAQSIAGQSTTFTFRLPLS